MLMTIKKNTFELEVRSSAGNLQTRYEQFKQWKDADLDFTENCVFIDEAEFHIDLRNEWVISGFGTPVIVKTPKIKASSHTTVGAIHAFSVIHEQ